jgi:prepilin peptidase CpaA
METLFQSIQSILLTAVLATAVVTDMRSRKIPNWLTFPAIACGVIVNSVLPGGHGPGFSFEGIAVSSIWLLLFLIGATGAGDVKLLWAVGALMGPKFAEWTLLCTMIAGGLLAVAYMTLKNEIRHTWMNTLVGGQAAAAMRSTDTLEGVARASRLGKMAYAPAIALGAAAAAYLLHSGITLPF